MNNLMRMLVFGFIVSFTSVLASAEESSCAQDIKKFCTDKNQSKAELIVCLKKNESKLSPKCQEKTKQFGQDFIKRIGELRSGCGDDARKFCANIKPGGGAIMNCLKENKNKISEKCKKLL